MAEIYYEDVNYQGVAAGQHVVWANVSDGDTCVAVARSKHNQDKTVQVFDGTFGSITLEGSSDPRVVTDPDNAVWFTLTSPQGNNIFFTAPGGEVIMESPRYIRPAPGAGTSGVTIILNRW